jgi:dolichol-phosphate mannosyltransferase
MDAPELAATRLAVPGLAVPELAVPELTVPELTVVVPCYNERANVAQMAARLEAALHGVRWEAIFVDDSSPDGTAQAVRALSRADPRIRCILRVGRRGLAGAVIEGALAAQGEVVAVIDGDLQHDETRLPAMLEALRAGADLAVGSRYMDGGDDSGLDGRWRRRLSGLGTRAARRLLRLPLTDPLSGFFMLRRETFERLAPRLTGEGFKILVDVVMSARGELVVREIPVRFHEREAGDSKLDVLVLLQFFGLLLDKALGGRVPLRFVSFAVVGLVGVAVHLAVLQVGRAAGAPFGPSQVAATLAAMLANFQLNNIVTYRNCRLRGRALWNGLAVFVCVCGVGAAADIGVARMLYAAHNGWNPSAVLGAAIGVVWNYAVSATLVWRRR